MCLLTIALFASSRLKCDSTRKHCRAITSFTKTVFRNGLYDLGVAPFVGATPCRRHAREQGSHVDRSYSRKSTKGNESRHASTHGYQEYYKAIAATLRIADLLGDDEHDLPKRRNCIGENHWKIVLQIQIDS